MLTVLHTADIHLDTAFSAHFDAESASKRRNELLHCFSDIIDMARNTDILLIAGDLFDSSYVSAETVSFLKRKFSEIPNTRVFICAGNHDPYTKNSVYEKEDFGNNVYVFRPEPESVEIPELKTRVFGMSFDAVENHSAESFHKIEKKDGYTDILLMHGDLTSAGGESVYNPIDRRFIENCGADYLALGHIHKRSEVKRYGNTYFAYPGSPEGRGFDECGDMGCYIVKIDGGVADAEFKRTCIRRMLQVEVDISGATDTLNAIDIIKDEIKKIGTSNDMYRIVLKGRLEPNTVNTKIIDEEIRKLVYYAEVKDKSQAKYDVEFIAKQNTLCGEFVRLMRAKISELSGDEKERAEMAMSLGIEALLGGEVQ